MLNKVVELGFLRRLRSRPGSGLFEVRASSRPLSTRSGWPSSTSGWRAYRAQLPGKSGGQHE
jgi:hypothetical protein